MTERAMWQAVTPDDVDPNAGCAESCCRCLYAYRDTSFQAPDVLVWELRPNAVGVPLMFDLNGGTYALTHRSTEPVMPHATSLLLDESQGGLGNLYVFVGAPDENLKLCALTELAKHELGQALMAAEGKVSI